MVDVLVTRATAVALISLCCAQISIDMISGTEPARLNVCRTVTETASPVALGVNVLVAASKVPWARFHPPVNPPQPPHVRAQS